MQFKIEQVSVSSEKTKIVSIFYDVITMIFRKCMVRHTMFESNWTRLTLL